MKLVGLTTRYLLHILAVFHPSMSGAMTSRTISRVVAPTVTNPMITRLIGTVDIDGAGTQHDLAEVDPFILLDRGTVPKNNMPPFGAHPHRGHSVVTILLGGKVTSWDSFRGNERHELSGPASYWVDAGSGIFHDERSVIENEDDPSQFMRIFQLWVGVREADRSKPPRVQYSDELPTVDCLNGGDLVGTATYHVGEGTGIETPHPISVAYITQKPGTTYHVPIAPTNGGFVIHMQGKATYGGGTEMDAENSIAVLANTDDDQGPVQLTVTTSTETSAEYLVCSGERNHEPWFKKLVANGAIIAKAPEEARELAPQVEAMSKAGNSGGAFAPFGMVI